MRSACEWNLGSRDVYVCENPSLAAIAADALGPHCAPLVCTNGMPTAAQGALLSRLAAAGGRMRYHGDFDWSGIAIANAVIDIFGASPWRFGAAGHCVALDKDARAMRPLAGNAVVAR